MYIEHYLDKRKKEVVKKQSTERNSIYTHKHRHSIYMYIHIHVKDKNIYFSKLLKLACVHVSITSEVCW